MMPIIGAGLNRLAYRTHDRPAFLGAACPARHNEGCSDGTKKPHVAACAVSIRDANPARWILPAHD